MNQDEDTSNGNKNKNKRRLNKSHDATDDTGNDNVREVDRQKTEERGNEGIASINTKLQVQITQELTATRGTTTSRARTKKGKNNNGQEVHEGTMRITGALQQHEICQPESLWLSVFSSLVWLQEKQ